MDQIMIKKLKNISVLYVEDEKHIRERITDTLKYYVKNIYEAENGEEGFDTYQKYKPDVILCDILMPVLDGISMVRKIRELDSQIPIIMITAHTEKQYLLDAVKLHLENYLIKPVTLPNILNELEKSLKKIFDSKSFLFYLPKDYIFNIEKKILLYKNKEVALNKKEFQFLELLIKNGHRVVKYDEFQNKIWGESVMTDNAIRSVVTSLRKKLPINLISNLSGTGYKLNYE